MSRDPDDPVAFVDHQRYSIALASCNSAIYQEILQLLVARHSGRAKSIAGAAAPDCQHARDIASDEGDRAAARHGTPMHGVRFGRAERLDGYRPSSRRTPDLPWDRQRIPEMVPRFRAPRPGTPAG